MPRIPCVSTSQPVNQKFTIELPQESLKGKLQWKINEVIILDARLGFMKKLFRLFFLKKNKNKKESNFFDSFSEVPSGLEPMNIIDF